MAKYYDFFLSYAWTDNEAPSSGLKKGWVDRFYATLQRELRDLWVSQIRAYRDENEIKSGEIQASISAALKQSDLSVSFPRGI